MWLPWDSKWLTNLVLKKTPLSQTHLLHTENVNGRQTYSLGLKYLECHISQILRRLPDFPLRDGWCGYEFRCWWPRAGQVAFQILRGQAREHPQHNKDQHPPPPTSSSPPLVLSSPPRTVCPIIIESNYWDVHRRNYDVNSTPNTMLQVPEKQMGLRRKLFRIISNPLLTLTEEYTMKTRNLRFSRQWRCIFGLLGCDAL
jgi:hypothetical protein